MKRVTAILIGTVLLLGTGAWLGSAWAKEGHAAAPGAGGSVGAKASHTIRGTVTYSAGGPAVGQLMRLVQRSCNSKPIAAPTTQQGLTDSKGAYLFTEVKTGCYDVGVVFEEGSTREALVEGVEVPGNNSAVDFVIENGPAPTVSPTGTITFTSSPTSTSTYTPTYSPTTTTYSPSSSYTTYTYSPSSSYTTYTYSPTTYSYSSYTYVPTSYTSNTTSSAIAYTGDGSGPTVVVGSLLVAVGVIAVLFTRPSRGGQHLPTMPRPGRHRL